MLGESLTPYRKEEETGKNEPEKVISFKDSAYEIFFTSWLNVLLACVPIAIICYIGGWSSVATFVFSLLALAPLAERLGFVTEQLALHTNETIGGLLNATFGNATELIVSIAALAKGLYKLVQLSLLGSILSNMLLVLGTAFFCGGLQFETQFYNKVSSQVNSTLLMLSVMGILFPTALYQSGKCSKLGELGLSRGTSLILFVLYFGFIYFQVRMPILFFMIFSYFLSFPFVSCSLIKVSMMLQVLNLLEIVKLTMTLNHLPSQPYTKMEQQLKNHSKHNLLLKRMMKRRKKMFLALTML